MIPMKMRTPKRSNTQIRMRVFRMHVKCELGHRESDRTVGSTHINGVFKQLARGNRKEKRNSTSDATTSAGQRVCTHKVHVRTRGAREHGSQGHWAM